MTVAASVTLAAGLVAGFAAPFLGAVYGMDFFAAPYFVAVALHGEEWGHASDSAFLTGFCLSLATYVALAFVPRYAFRRMTG